MAALAPAPPPAAGSAAATPVASEAELVARLAELSPSSVAVVEVFSEAWGPCKSLASCFKRLRADHDDHLALLSVAAERIGGGAAASGAANKGTAAAAAKAALAAIAARQGKSEPMFAVFRGGVLRESVRGADPPQLTALVEGLMPSGAAGAPHKEAAASAAAGDDDEAGAAAGGGGAAEASANNNNPFKALLQQQQQQHNGGGAGR